MQPLFLGKGRKITYPKRVFVALGIQHAMSIHHIVTCSLPGSTIFLHTIS